MSWPNDVDGDVFRRMEENGFDFTIEYAIDFNIDFDSWPLDKSTKESILAMFPSCEFVEPDEEDIAEGNTIGYAQFQIVAKPTHELVVSIQEQVTKKLKRLGGWCESWGVMQE